MNSSVKQKTLLIIFISVAFIYIVRLFYLQVVDTSYVFFAQNNVLQEQTIYPARGLIYDRKGELLVYNDAIYDLSVIPDQVRNLDTTEFCKVLNISKEEFLSTFARLKRQKGYSKWKPIVFQRQITIPTYAAFQEKLFDFQGFFVEVRTDRKYKHSNAAHVMGYIGEVTDRDIEKSDGYYRMGDFMGISGVERIYEKELGGIKGTRYVLVDSKNRTQGRYKNGEFDTAAIAGKDIHLSIDQELQALGEALLQNKTGSVVAIEPRTGEVLALVSSPSYDPNLMVGRERGNRYMELLKDPSKPLFNRPISAPYPPGSIFKVIVGLMGQQEKVLFPNTSYGCNHGYLFVGCHPHGSPLALRGAIAVSCNAYFCQVYRSIVNNPRYKHVEDAYTEFYKHAYSFGMGHALGIDLFGEGQGVLKKATYFDKIYGRHRWQALTTISMGIGQGELGITPLQMANATAAIANRGYFYTPHIVKKINNRANPNPKYTTKNWTTIDTGYFPVVIEGMHDVIENGTARIAKIPGIEICGKTGTAQNPHGKDHSIFFAFAPKNNPKIAIAVVVENSGFGATWAAPIASLMMEQYLTGKHDTRKALLERMLNGNLTHRNDSARFKTK
ncbi:MAG: penicillin-binding protein 2 [Bacteroidota bacterium]|nr:penicillin-binding protein 2 [Bacteroidota bacterium]